jgi:23S rRNA (uracil1939-C5)-methyltransferase
MGEDNRKQTKGNQKNVNYFDSNKGKTGYVKKAGRSETRGAAGRSETGRAAGRAGKPEGSGYERSNVKSERSGYIGKSGYAGRNEFNEKAVSTGKTGFRGRTGSAERTSYTEKSEQLRKADTFEGKDKSRRYTDKSKRSNDVYEITQGNGKHRANDNRDKKSSNVRNQNSGFEEVQKTRDNIKSKPSGNRISDYDKRSSVHREKPQAIKGSCPYIRECGGCNIMQQSYEAELKEKQKTVEKLINKFCKVEPIIGMKDPNYYRNKVHVVFDHDRKGNPISGVYEEGTHRVIPVESCLIHNQKADAIIASIRGMLKSFKIKTYDEDTGYGLLRHVLIRTGFASGEIMVVLVLASPILPSKNNFVKALRKEHPEITTVVVNVNDKKTSMVLGDKEQVIYGKGFIEDKLCDKVFRISPKSFYQVNPAQTEVLYGKAIEMAGLTGNETVIDAYCGIGTIGLIASDHVQKVIGVELNKDAVRDANINAKRNEAANIEFYNNDAGDFMSQMAAQKETVDLVFMDPPRTGSNEKFMDALVTLKPKKVVYISCNPVTLERDLQYLTKKGYKAEKAIPVDMFPWTQHVETVVLMSKVQK